MSGVFIIRNQLGHYWGKSGSWVKGGRAGQVACWTHKDEAVNTLFEIGSGNTDLRGEILLVEADNDHPTNLEISKHPLPKPDTVDELENNGDDPHV